MLYTNPNDYDRPTDSGRIQKAIIEAKRSGCNQVIIPRMNEATGKSIWIIDETILLPSDITIIFDNCHLRMADGVMCQMFRNENALEDVGMTVEGRQEHIHLIGRGNVLLDGGEDNGLREKTCCRNGLPHVMHNLTVFFRNVHHFSIENITVRDQRWWGICFLYSAYGRVSNVHFEITVRYERTHVETGYWRNQDGIDMRVGCHDITIENITGEVGDDVVACTALGSPGSFEEEYRVEGESKNIYNISVHNVKATCNYCAMIRLLCHYGNQIYNVSIDNVAVKEDAPVRPGVVIRLNEHFYFGKDINNKAKMGAIHNVSINNVYASAHAAAIQFNGELCDISVRDVYAKGDGHAFYAGPFVMEDPDADHLKDHMKNVIIEGVHTALPVHNFDHVEMENVVIRDIFESEF